MAFYCSHIALHTIEENENVMIYGPAVMNAEVLCYKGSLADVRTVGISQGRQNEKEQAQITYPQIEEFQEITQKGILYSLENGQVDAVIQDLTKAANVPEYSCSPIAETDYVSYVLVVDKDFVGTAEFSEFVETYNRAARKLNDPEYLAGKLGVEEDWLRDKSIRFLTLELP